MLRDFPGILPFHGTSNERYNMRIARYTMETDEYKFYATVSDTKFTHTVIDNDGGFEALEMHVGETDQNLTFENYFQMCEVLDYAGYTLEWFRTIEN